MQEILRDPHLYMASPAGILSVLRTVRETKARTVMIVGHNPGLEELVAQLTGNQLDLPTAALAQIVLPIDEWRDLKLSTHGKHFGLWRPKELKATAEQMLADQNHHHRVTETAREPPALFLQGMCRPENGHRTVSNYVSQTGSKQRCH